MPYRKNFVVAAVSLLSAVTLLASCNSSSSTVALNGAGSTFVYPVMGRWIQDFQRSHPNVRINYQSIGSGGGIQQVKSEPLILAPPTHPFQTRIWRRWRR